MSDDGNDQKEINEGMGKAIEEIIEPHRNNRRSPSIFQAFPEVAQEWCYERNCGFGPEDFSYGSNVRAWWICRKNKNHIWQTAIYQRCLPQRGCPYCYGKNLRKTPVIQERSLAHCFPEIAKEWHPSKNGQLTPENVLWGSHRKIWWKCVRNPRHVWQASIKSRTTLERGCRLCYEEQFLDLRKFPEILKLFDKEKNRLDPRKLTTHMWIWWRCQKGPDHSWRGRFNKKTLFCPYCRNRKVSVTNSLQALFPKLAKQLHPTRNGKLTAANLAAYTSKRVWWRCSYNPRHVWYAQVNNRTRLGSGCPHCWDIRRRRSTRAERLKLG